MNWFLRFLTSRLYSRFDVIVWIWWGIFLSKGMFGSAFILLLFGAICSAMLETYRESRQPIP